MFLIKQNIELTILTDNNRIVNGGVSRKFVERKIGTRNLPLETFQGQIILVIIIQKIPKDSRNDIVDYRPLKR